MTPNGTRAINSPSRRLTVISYHLLVCTIMIQILHCQTSPPCAWKPDGFVWNRDGDVRGASSSFKSNGLRRVQCFSRLRAADIDGNGQAKFRRPEYKASTSGTQRDTNVEETFDSLAQPPNQRARIFRLWVCITSQGYRW